MKTGKTGLEKTCVALVVTIWRQGADGNINDSRMAAATLHGMSMAFSHAKMYEEAEEAALLSDLMAWRWV